ncbi:MAG TPA: carboxypeptidase-like regulatory domain-containing protein, partial [Polyangiaceae bacterium]
MPARTSRYSWLTFHFIPLWVALILMLGVRTAHAQSGTGVLTGTVSDAQEHKPVADVVVTVTSPALQGEQVVVTDASGFYRIPDLPAGENYTIRLEKEGYKPYARGGIALHSEATLRANADLLPDTLKAEEVVVVAQAPTVDVGSSSTGAALNKDFTRRVPLAAPGGKGSASRSFEAVAAATPGASEDRMGVSISGASSPENAYVIDGLSVNNPGIGTIGSPLSSEFVDEVNVISAGYMPEFGRSTGGTISATTKSGSDEFHGGAFAYFSPGALEGPRRSVRQDVGAVAFDTKLNHIGDIGLDLGGPIIRQKLWFYVGIDLSHESYGLSRYFRSANANGDGYTKIAGTDQAWDAVATQFQGIGKLTWAVNADNKITLSANMTPTWSGGRNKFGVDPISGGPEINASTIN